VFSGKGKLDDVYRSDSGNSRKDCAQAECPSLQANVLWLSPYCARASQQYRWRTVEIVRVEWSCPSVTTPRRRVSSASSFWFRTGARRWRATAVVRHQRERCFGLQFLRLSVEQQSIVRYWRDAKANFLLTAQGRRQLGRGGSQTQVASGLRNSENSRREFGIRRIVAFAVSIT